MVPKNNNHVLVNITSCLNDATKNLRTSGHLSNLTLAFKSSDIKFKVNIK